MNPTSWYSCLCVAPSTLNRADLSNGKVFWLLHRLISEARTRRLGWLLPCFWRRQWHPTPVLLPGESQGRGAWWAAVYGVAQSQTRLKRLGSSSSLVLSGITLAGRNQLPCHEDTGHMRTWHRAKAFRQVTIPVRVPLWKRTLLASRAFG